MGYSFRSGGETHTRGLQNLSRLLSHHGCGVKPCPLCDKAIEERTVLQHVMEDHGERLGLSFENNEVVRNWS